MILEDDINLIDNDIYIDDVGKIGEYNPFYEEIVLGFEIKAYLDKEKTILCKPYEIKNKIVELFINDHKLFMDATDDKTKRILK